jgi:branched-chain amino acid transport system permease protein
MTQPGVNAGANIGANSSDIARLGRHERWKPLELVFWLAVASAYFVFPQNLVLASQVLIAGLFALSLDLILGYAGIVTLGHAAFFGVGAYTAGLLAKYGWGEPLSGLVIAALVSAFVGWVTSFLVLRGGDLARLMTTLGIASLLYEGANRMTSITGGVDGLQGVEVAKVFGLFSFDMYGRTGFVYAFVVVLVVFVVARSWTHSPYGLSLRAIRENPVRARAIGIPLHRRLVTVYVVSAGVAGIAGALLTQTTQFVGLDVLSFQRSANLLIMLIVGGTATLYGGFVGAALFMLVQDRLANINPVYWLFWLGILLILVTLFLRRGVVGTAITWNERRRGRDSADSTS